MAVRQLQILGEVKGRGQARGGVSDMTNELQTPMGV